MFKVKTVLITFVSILLLAVAVWLGGSYYLMQNTGPEYLSFFIYTEKESLGANVQPDFPTRTGSTISYSFPVKFWSLEENDNQFTLSLSASSYGRLSLESTSERFTYSLDKNKNSLAFDPSTLKRGDSLFLSTKYDLSNNIQQYLEFSKCALWKEFSKLFNIDNSCSRGNCYVSREVKGWEIEVLNKGENEKLAFFNEFEKDILSKELTNYFLTDDLGYFDSSSFKYLSTQKARPDGTFQFESSFVDSVESGTQKGFIPIWFLNIVSELQNSEEYSMIDFNSYFSTVIGYIDNDNLGKYPFLSCEVAYSTITKLDTCTSTTCDSIKNISSQYCKASLEEVLNSYDENINNYKGYATSSFLEGYMFAVGSEMIHYNQLVDEGYFNGVKYTEEEIVSYSDKAKSKALGLKATVPLCYALKSSKTLYSSFQKSKYIREMNSLYDEISDFTTLCDNNDAFCSVSPSEKLICVDALNEFKSDQALILLADIFYSHYYKSSGAFKLQSYENARKANLHQLQRGDTSKKLSDYGYLTFSKKQKDVSANFAALIDSYYFVYLLNDIDNE